MSDGIATEARANAPVETALAALPALAGDPALEVSGLSISFRRYAQGLHHRELRVVSDLDLAVMPGELVAVVGASGSGKSLLAHAILGILPSNALVAGTMRFQGRSLTPELQARLRGREIALIPQSVSWLDPLMRVGLQVRSAVRQGAVTAQREVFERYGLGRSTERLYPFQLSGGMARRVLVATAVLAGARLIIADEPTPGLDGPSIAEALGHLRELADGGAAVVLITHDLEAGLAVADRVAVFYSGTTVEFASVTDFSGSAEQLRHPYSRALWRALPANGFEPFPGAQPAPDEPLHGCPFHPRCALRNDECLRELPPFRPLRSGKVRCLHAA